MFKLMKNSLREYKIYAILTPLVVLLEVFIEVSLPMLVANITNEFNKGGMEVNKLVMYGLILLALAGTSLCLGVLSGRFSALGATGFAKNLRKDVYTNVQNFSFKDVDQFSNSSLVTRLTTDITNIQNSYAMITRVAIRVPMLLIMSIVMAFVVSPEMAMYFVIVMPIMAGGLLLIVSRVFPLFDRIFPKYDKLNKSIQENIKGIRVVKTFSTEDKERSNFEEKARDIQRDFTKAEKIISLNSPLMSFSMFAIQMLIYGFGSKLIVESFEVELAQGDLSALLTYSTTMLMALMMLMMVFAMISISRTNCKRVLEVIEYVPTMEDHNEVTEVKSGEIEFKKVNFRYKDSSEKNTLDNFNIHIKAGLQIGIIGGTGSGKSSFVNLIPRLYDINEGELLIGGVSVSDYNLEALRDQVAVVLQKNVLFSGTIRENLKWGNENATDEEIMEACDNACCTEFLKKFPDGLDTMIEQGGMNVSGGQKQRLCIARALLKNPKIIILDDSTSAVDTKTDMMINDAFKQNLKDTTKLIISQRISSIEKCDSIIVLDEGKITGFDTHANLIKNNVIYKEIYDVQMQNKSTDDTVEAKGDETNE
ncbi:MAG: ABC transporter ATP-binding protein [Mycoplasmatota bacterium]